MTDVVSWLENNFEPVRPEAWPDAPASALVCLRCGSLVFRYSAASHMRRHNAQENEAMVTGEAFLAKYHRPELIGPSD